MHTLPSAGRSGVCQYQFTHASTVVLVLLCRQLQRATRGEVRIPQTPDPKSQRRLTSAPHLNSLLWSACCTLTSPLHPRNRSAAILTAPSCLTPSLCCWIRTPFPVYLHVPHAPPPWLIFFLHDLPFSLALCVPGYHAAVPLSDSFGFSSPHPQSYASPMSSQLNSGFFSRLLTMLCTKQPHMAAAVRDET